ncbi:hypothetical protein GCM10011575_30940 [Microlunatus endophyticus]|uniref:Cell division protein CrgA n=1 Tax=Microlunatus endophyticus TaxID=1716077 RepID=A0A917SD78_9ACTN|nr:hypothetical protein GCM10011575_30940 [Microlunatus endophyticus]
MKKATSAADKTDSTTSGSATSDAKSATSKTTSKTATSKSTASATAKRVSRRIEQESKPKGRRWLLPAAIVLAVLGAAWGVAHFVTPKLIPGEHGLGKWNILIGAGAILVAAIGYLVLRPRTTSPYAIGTRRWVPPTFITVGLLGVAWLIVYYIAGSSVPFMNTLGNWNILIGMAGMAGAFIIATLWK